ncbi:hypothetical protein PsYK624_169570 [Phanerochaete sordida]|uniref:Uncharacterized protein n=1 Tax=Phanerochaete sordida TaxID=48140 RepID=A0A9P3LMQ2_9APHY|nr:hypothetical protein PsYK624_169570 [Phanerochaete sordida]
MMTTQEGEGVMESMKTRLECTRTSRGLASAARCASTAARHAAPIGRLQAEALFLLPQQRGRRGGAHARQDDRHRGLGARAHRGLGHDRVRLQQTCSTCSCATRTARAPPGRDRRVAPARGRRARPTQMPYLGAVIRVAHALVRARTSPASLSPLHTLYLCNGVEGLSVRRAAAARAKHGLARRVHGQSRAETRTRPASCSLACIAKRSPLRQGSHPAPPASHVRPAPCSASASCSTCRARSHARVTAAAGPGARQHRCTPAEAYS